MPSGIAARVSQAACSRGQIVNPADDPGTGPLIGGVVPFSPV